MNKKKTEWNRSRKEHNFTVWEQSEFAIWTYNVGASEINIYPKCTVEFHSISDSFQHTFMQYNSFEEPLVFHYYIYI